MGVALFLDRVEYTTEFRKPLLFCFFFLELAFLFPQGKATRTQKLKTKELT